jgi:DNA repair exonuclease SbcCD ATPase subunit
MIPLRVYLKNFLCHSEQEFVFDGHPVWLLHGPNGVGKSAVFDAIVYALFGEHRRREGGKAEVADLVRYGESSMRVEFDFEYGGHRYRVWRIRTRSGHVDQGVGEFLDGNPVPRPLSHANRVAELRQWVTDTLGLDYDTFVSAVLLRQGAAERLIDAKKEVRRDVFRGIIDLEPYIRLHKAVTEARAEVSGGVRALRGALLEMPEVTDDQIATATLAREKATTAWEGAWVAERAARDRLVQARVWDGLNEACRTARQQLDAARDRADRAGELEQFVRRLRTLRNVVPALARLSDLRRAADDAGVRLERLQGEQTTAAGRLAELVAAAEQERGKAVTHRDRVTELDGQIAAATAERDRLGAEIERADRAAGLHGQLAELQARRFDADLNTQLARAEELVADAQAARDASPHLEAILSHRTAYKQATADAGTATDAEGAATADVARLGAAEQEAACRAGAEEVRAEKARQDAAVAAARLTTARGQLTDFCTVEGEAACLRCRQPIGPEHFERERGELERGVREAETEAGRRGEESQAVTEAAQAARKVAEELESARRQAEALRDGAARSCRDAETRADQARTAFAHARTELSPGLAEKVGAIDGAGFPTDADINRARETGRQLQHRTLARDELQERRQEQDRTAEAIKTLTQAVIAVGAPPDVTEARAELARREQQLTDLRRDRGTAELARSDAERAERGLAQSIPNASGEVNRLAGEVGAAQAKAEKAREDYEGAKQALPDGAVNSDLDALAAELQRLEEAGVERDFEALAKDRDLQAERERRMAEVERQIEEQVAPEARRPSTEVEPEVTAAERATQEAGQGRDVAREKLAELDRQRRHRDEALRRLSDAERSHGLHNQLADLLGDKGIQLALLRQAERRIIELANDTLGRVSRGELRFEPPDLTVPQALDLSVRRAGCPDPIPVANLSGGQRCRVAIALALAVCRFACGEAQPLQSVIIDEAFANLDRDGRMAMIDVIRDGHTAGHTLQRIIVVSHHEDVAAAFPVGYRLSSEGGVTRAERYPPRPGEQ